MRKRLAHALRRVAAHLDRPTSIPPFKLDINVITNHADSTGLIREMNRRQMDAHLAQRGLR